MSEPTISHSSSAPQRISAPKSAWESAAISREIAVHSNLEPSSSAPAASSELSLLVTPKADLLVEQRKPRAQAKVAEMYEKLFDKLFIERADEPRIVYKQELNSAAQALNSTPADLIKNAVSELHSLDGRFELDEDGVIVGVPDACANFHALHRLILKKVDLHVIYDHKQLESERKDFALSPSCRRELERILDQGEISAIFLVKSAPAEVAEEFRQVTNEQAHGLLSPWEHKEFIEHLNLKPSLRSYIDYATIRVLCTGGNALATDTAARINTAIEQSGIENKHRFRLLMGEARREKQESLLQSGIICGTLMIGVKMLEKYCRSIMHLGGGVGDDLLSALPNLWQDRGPKGARLKPIIPQIKALALSIPAAMALGWGSAVIYSAFTSSASMRALAGVMFALACCGRSAAIAAGAVYKAYKSLSALQQDPKCPPEMKTMDRWEKFKCAYGDAINSSPFRIGQINIGIPAQIGIALWAALSFNFTNGTFVGAEGALETLAGAVFAGCFQMLATVEKADALSKLEIPPAAAAAGAGTDAVMPA